MVHLPSLNSHIEEAPEHQPSSASSSAKRALDQHEPLTPGLSPNQAGGINMHQGEERIISHTFTYLHPSSLKVDPTLTAHHALRHLQLRIQTAATLAQRK